MAGDGPSSAGPSRNSKFCRYKNGRRRLTEHISSRSIKRLARRGGVKRMSAMIYPEMKEILRTFLTNLVRDSVIYCEYDGRKTVMAKDVIQAMKVRGQRLYGFDDLPFPITIRSSIRLTDTESTAPAGESQQSSQQSSPESTDKPVPGSSQQCSSSHHPQTSTPVSNKRNSSANTRTLEGHVRNLRKTTTENTYIPIRRKPTGSNPGPSSHVADDIPSAPGGNRESALSDSDSTVDDLNFENMSPLKSSNAGKEQTKTPVRNTDILGSSDSTVENDGNSPPNDGNDSEGISDCDGIEPLNPYDEGLM